MATLLRQLNLTSSVQTSDMERILEAVIRAKESFKESSKEQAAARGRLKQLADKVTKFDEFVAETSQTIKVVVLALIMLAGFLVHLVCSLETKLRTETGPETRDSATMTELTEPKIFSKPVRKVDLSPVRDRRSTWCGGSQGTLRQGQTCLKQRTEGNQMYKRIRFVANIFYCLKCFNYFKSI